MSQQFPDLNILTIVNVFHQRQNHWRRNVSAIRDYDAAVLFLDGEITYYFPDQEVTVKKGDLFLIPGNVPYYGKRSSEWVEFIVIDFLCAEADELHASRFPMVTEGQSEILGTRFQNLLELWTRQPADAILQAKSTLYSILASIARNDWTEERKERIDEIIDYIVGHLSDAHLDLKLLCGHFFISESQLRRNLEAATGLSPNAYIKKLRINQAKNMLAYTSMNIHEISEACGFSTPYYFSHCFVEACGTTPSAYRKKQTSI